MMKRQEHMMYEERLRDLRLFGPKKRRVRRYLAHQYIYKHTKEGCKESGVGLLSETGREAMGTN